MNKRLGLCSGSLHKCFGNDLAKFVLFCEKNCIFDIEITLRQAEEIDQLNFSPNILSFLEKCSFKSLHFPFKEKVNRENKAILDKIYALYDKYNFNHITVHPNMVDDFSLLKNKRYNISIENVKPKRDFDIDKIRHVLDENKHFGFVLDTSHAFGYGDEKVPVLFQEFSGECDLVHLSDLDHNLFHIAPETRKNIMVNLLNKINCPVFVEVSVNNEDAVAEEIKILQQYFNSLTGSHFH